jgi:uncharacterized protein YegP (UPF0339 family)
LAALIWQRTKGRNETVTHENEKKFVLYPDLNDGRYRWRLRSHTGETLSESPTAHSEKSACEAELRAFLADHQGAELLGATATGDAR